ncbi:hypothetical protein RBB79_15010 [Tunturiibacter empetritectus]|nr:hypothetical protein [Edaphobacter lichenicola]
MSTATAVGNGDRQQQQHNNSNSQQQIPCGDDNKNDKGNCNSNTTAGILRFAQNDNVRRATACGRAVERLDQLAWEFRRRARV